LRRARRQRSIEIVIHAFYLQCCHTQTFRIETSKLTPHDNSSSFMKNQSKFMNYPFRKPANTKRIIA